MPSPNSPSRLMASRISAMRALATQASRMRAFPSPISPLRVRRSAIWSLGLDGGFSGQQPHAQPDHGFDSFTEESAQDYVMASQGGNSGQVPPSDPRRQLQAFDALYDQPPQIALGSTDPSRRAPQDFYESDRVDADFLDEATGRSASWRALQDGDAQEPERLHGWQRSAWRDRLGRGARLRL